ncbi:unnamed protein product, partial [Ostreobium quekettii]
SAIQFGSFPGLQHMEVPGPPFAPPQGLPGYTGPIPTPYYQGAQQPPQQQHGPPPPRPSTSRRGLGGPKHQRPPASGPPASGQGQAYTGQMGGAPPQGPGGAYYPYSGMPYPPVGYVEQGQGWPGWGGERASSRIPFEGQGPPAARSGSSAASDQEQPWSPSSSASGASHNPREKKAIPLIDPRSNKAITGDKGVDARGNKTSAGEKGESTTEKLSYRDAFGRKTKSAAPHPAEAMSQDKSGGQKLGRSHSGEVRVIHTSKPGLSRGGSMTPPQHSAHGGRMLHPTARGQGSTPSAAPAQASVLHRTATPAARPPPPDHKSGQSGLHKVPVPEAARTVKKSRPLGVVSTSFVHTPVGPAKNVGPSQEAGGGRALSGAVDGKGVEASLVQEKPEMADKLPVSKSQEVKSGQAETPKKQDATLENGLHVGKPDECHPRSLPDKSGAPAKEESDVAKPKWGLSKKGWSAIQQKPSVKVLQPHAAAQPQQGRQATRASPVQRAAEASKSAQKVSRAGEPASVSTAPPVQPAPPLLQAVEAAKKDAKEPQAGEPASASKAQQVQRAPPAAESALAPKSPEATETAVPAPGPKSIEAQESAARAPVPEAQETGGSAQTPNLLEAGETAASDPSTKSPEAQEAAVPASNSKSFEVHEAAEAATSPDAQPSVAPAVPVETITAPPKPPADDEVDKASQPSAPGEQRGDRIPAPEMPEAVVISSSRFVAADNGTADPAAATSAEATLDQDEPSTRRDEVQGNPDTAEATEGIATPPAINSSSPATEEATGVVVVAPAAVTPPGPPDVNPSGPATAEAVGDSGVVAPAAVTPPGPPTVKPSIPATAEAIGVVVDPVAVTPPGPPTVTPFGPATAEAIGVDVDPVAVAPPGPETAEDEGRVAAKLAVDCATAVPSDGGAAPPVAVKPADGSPGPEFPKVAAALASPEGSKPSISGTGDLKASEENERSPVGPTSRRYYSMDALKGLRAANFRTPDSFDKGPWSRGDEGLLPPRRSGSLKAVARSHSFNSNSGDQLKRDWRGILGPPRTRSSLKIDDAEIDHKRSGKRVYVFDFLLKLKPSLLDKPSEIAVGPFLRDAIAPTRSMRGTDRWASRGSRDSVGDRDRERDRRDRDHDRDLPSRSTGGLWTKDPAQGRSGSSRSYRSRAGCDRGKGIEDDRWGKAPLPQSPFSAPESQLHRAENRYVVGKSTSEDPEEEKRQKSFKSILNKLTPDNFQKMFNKMKDVEIGSAQTLTGLIDQIFDKALIETTFCALYASLCKLLSTEMPEFTVEGDPRKVTFRRLLLNKCQAEFEKGDAAMRAAEQASELGTEESARILIQAKKERMRSLGNMQFIGHLFKEGMLTEKIIHQCIVELLREEKSPKPEDIECLCKLVATVGRRLTQRSELKAYFLRVARLAENQNLDVRHRFMLLDLIEMKDRGWVERRKQEGPKTIEEIHKEAAREQQSIRERGRGGGGGHWGGSRSARHLEDRIGGGMWGRNGPPPSQGRPGPTPSPTPPLMRGEEVRPLTRIKSLGRTDSQEISLRPAGRLQQQESPGLQRGPISPPKEPARERPVLNLAPPSRKAVAQESSPLEEAPEAMTEELLGRKVKGLLEEYYNDMDNMEEPVKCVEELKSAGAQTPEILSTSVQQALNIRGMDAAKRLLPLADLMIALCQGHPEGSTPVVSPSDMEKGVEGILEKIPDVAEDFPNAPRLIGRLLGILVSQDIVSLEKMGSMVLAGGGPGEDSPLVDSGAGSTVILEVLKELKDGKEADELESVKRWLASVSIADYYASYEREAVKQEDVLAFLDD